MSDRRKILELFENQEMQQKIQANIEQYRKGDMELVLTDENGAPIPGAKIYFTQQSHEFRFGANVFMLDELETEQKNHEYKKKFADLFNMATVPFYWKDTEPEKGLTRYEKDSPKVYRRPPVDLCLEFCKDYGIEPREHALAYDRFFPLWLKGADTETVKRELEAHFAEIAARYADKIDTIEVTNEMFWTVNHITEFYYEPDFVEWCFKTARKYFPGNKLVINEAHSFTFEETLDESSKYIQQIKNALEIGTPIDAIGTQAHFFYKREQEYEKTRKMLDPVNMYHDLDRLAAFGKPLQITEVTFPSYTWEEENEDIQAEMLEKLYSLWFSHPAMEQIIYWNLVDGYAHVWAPNREAIRQSQGNMTIGENIYRGGLLRFDMTPKPAYHKLKELLTKTWHTEKSLLTDQDGKVRFRGFYGDYRVLIEADNKVTEKTISLSAKGNKHLALNI